MNTSKFRILGLGMTLAALLGFSGMASAAQTGPYGMTPERQAVIEKMHEDYYAKTNAVRQQLISKQHELNAQIYSPTPDEKKIQALTKEISDLRGKMFEARVALKQQMAKEGFGGGWGRGYGGWGHGGGGWGHGGRGGCGGYSGGGCGPCGNYVGER